MRRRHELLPPTRIGDLCKHEEAMDGPHTGIVFRKARRQDGKTWPSDAMIGVARFRLDYYTKEWFSGSEDALSHLERGVELAAKLEHFAARRIQMEWREAIASPRRALCRARLMRELRDMVDA